MMLIFIFLLCAPLCNAQTSIGLDLASFLYKELNIDAEHQISKHWSFSTSAGVNLKALKRKVSNEEIEHTTSFYSDVLPAERPFSHREEFSIRYWANRVYSGMFLSVGGEYRTDTKLDTNIGIGYTFPIWKGLTGSIIYDTGIIRSSKTKMISADDFKISLSWIF